MEDTAADGAVAMEAATDMTVDMDMVADTAVAGKSWQAQRLQSVLHRPDRLVIW